MRVDGAGVLLGRAPAAAPRRPAPAARRWRAPASSSRALVAAPGNSATARAAPPTRSRASRSRRAAAPSAHRAEPPRDRRPAPTAPARASTSRSATCCAASSTRPASAPASSRNRPASSRRPPCSVPCFGVVRCGFAGARRFRVPRPSCSPASRHPLGQRPAAVRRLEVGGFAPPPNPPPAAADPSSPSSSAAAGTTAIARRAAASSAARRRPGVRSSRQGGQLGPRRAHPPHLVGQCPGRAIRRLAPVPHGGRLQLPGHRLGRLRRRPRPQLVEPRRVGRRRAAPRRPPAPPAPPAPAPRAATRPAPAALATRRSRNHCSTSAKCCVPNSFSSSFSRSPVSAHRNRANSPCGSSTTWKNWSLLIPSSRSIVRPTSSIRVSPSGACPLGAAPTQVSDAFACCFVVPPPRFFAPLGTPGCARAAAGGRARSAPAAPRSPPPGRRSRTAAASPGPAPRAPTPNNANATASSSVVLPAPVSPCSRNNPSAPSRSKSTTSCPGYGPNAVSSSRCSLMRPGARAVRQLRLLLVGHRRERLPQQRRSPSLGAAPRQSSTKSHATSWSDRPRTVVAYRRDAASAAARRPPVQVHRVREPLLQATQRIRRPHPVGQLHRQVLVDQPHRVHGRSTGSESVPLTVASGRGTGSSRRSTPASPCASRSTSHTDLWCRASENE